MVKLEKLTKESFDLLQYPILFQEEKANNIHAILRDSDVCFKLIWRSDLIDPCLTEIDSGKYAIGIDQHYAIVDFKQNAILMVIDLLYNFYECIVYKNWILVISELEVIIILKANLKIISEYGLPDFFQEIKFDENKVDVMCLGNITVNINLHK